LYNAGIRQHVFDRYEDIPPLVVKALLFVENRELEDLDTATRNPVVEMSMIGTEPAAARAQAPFASLSQNQDFMTQPLRNRNRECR